MKHFDKYKTKLPFPVKRNYTTVYLYRHGEILFKGTTEEYIKVNTPIFPKDSVMEKVINTEMFKGAWEHYKQDEARLIDEFKNDLFAEFDVSGDKAEKAFVIAWDRGHSSGFAEVYNQFIDLVDLIS